MLLLIGAATQAYAIGFTGELGNEATFETLQEANQNSVNIVSSIVENDTKAFATHPVLDGYPEGTTFVYRSANQYAGRAAARLNTNIFVYAPEHFENKDDAMAYLKDLGLIKLIDEAVGSIVLVTPIGDSFDMADVASYYALQTAMLSQKEAKRLEDGTAIYYSDAEYFGGYGFEYFIGIDDGATFFNNYIAPEIDFSGRMAGVLLFGGDMQRTRQPATFIPIALVNSDEAIVSKYRAVNGVNAQDVMDGRVVSYNQQWPLRKVIDISEEIVDKAALIEEVYRGMMVKAMRVPVLTQGMNSAGTPYSGYGFDEAPYSLCDRCYVVDGKTEGGVVMISHQGDDDRFAEYKTEAGEYIDVWYEYLPQEVLDGTAPAGSVPLILCNHGGGDDARVFVDEFGLIELSEKERVALVAPDHQTVGSVRGPALTAVAKYMLEKYPALDASRVYMTGYSMGGGATYLAAYHEPTLFAAIAPFAGSATPMPEENAANFDGVELPTILSISAFDPAGRRLAALEGNLNEAEQGMVSTWAGINGKKLPAFDFEKYPLFGQKADRTVTDTINDEFARTTWYFNNEKGEPRFAFIYMEDMVHALYPEYADMLWDFVKNYSRDPETKEIIYNAYR
mgnify:FL=1